MILFYLIFILSLLFIILYVFLIGKFVAGWNKIAFFKTKETLPETAISVIVACKNEIDNLSKLFQALKNQSYPNFEVIFVDDHSSDGSREYAIEAQPGFPQLKVVENEANGKKSAIRTGVYLADNELIVSLDADSVPSQDWLKSIVQFYEQHPADLIIAPVRMDTDGSFFQNFQQFEFTSLVGTGAGAAGAGMPIFCNGANLVFRREAWLKSEPELRFDIPSGDDIFLLQSIKKRGETIHFLKSTDAVTITKPVESLKLFFRQRKRWASKKPIYKDKHLAYTGFVVFMANFSIIVSLALTVVDFRFFYLSLLLLGLKWITDNVFFKKVKTFFKLKNVLKNSILFSFIYPFYLVIAGVYSLLGKRKQTW